MAIGERFEPKFKKGDRIKIIDGRVFEVLSEPIWDDCWNEWTYDLGGLAMPCECWMAEMGAVLDTCQ